MGALAEALVVGAGHNGLVCAGYLARAGVDVTVLEARDGVGGTAATVDALGARVNICNCEHVMFRSTPIAAELDLDNHGLRYIDVEPAMMNMGWDSSPPWFVFHDVERTLESISLAHPAEVDGYRRYLDDALPAARLLLEIGNRLPRRRSLLQAASRRPDAARTILRWQRATALDVLRSYFRDDALIGPAIVGGPASWGLSPEDHGTGLGALTYALKHAVQTGRPAGGSGALPAALSAAVEESGGRVRCGAQVSHVEVDRGTVRGVELVTGERLASPVVVSAADPRTTFVRWLRGAPSSASRLVERWRRRSGLPGYESKVDAVITRAPRYRAIVPEHLERLGVPEPLVATAMVGPPTREILAGHALMTEGKVAERLMHYVNVPTALDPDFWPERGPERHVFSLECIYTPYDVDGGWPGGEPARWLERFADLVEPGFLDGIEDWRAVTPDRYESDFHVPRGTPPAFVLSPLDLLVGRNRELTSYRTGIDGLFLTGAGTFPGAGIWGASGRHAAGEVLAHLGRKIRDARGRGSSQKPARAPFP